MHDDASVLKRGALGPLVMAVLALALAAAAALLAAAPAEAAPVRCGQVLVKSTTLDRSLFNCPGNGLVIGRGGITVNLNGHTVDGAGKGSGIVNNGFDDVRIVNTNEKLARVTQFEYGVRLNTGTLRNLVERTSFEGNKEAAIGLNNADSNTVRSNRVSTSDNVAVHLAAGSNSNTLRGNVVNGSGDSAVSIENSHGNRLERNQVGTGGRTGDDQVGIGDAGVSLSFASSNVLVSNVVRNSSDAAISLMESDGNTLGSNDVQFNPTGIALEKANRNKVQSNNASNSTGEGIEVKDSLDNDLVLNTASSNQSQGIAVSGVTGRATGNLLDRNTASNNKGDGIGVSGSGHTIRSNTARNNDGWGIYAAPGNVDGGGNRASGNAEPAQCFGVRCTS